MEHTQTTKELTFEKLKKAVEGNAAFGRQHRY